MARVGNMSRGICLREEGANSVRGPNLNDQIVLKGRVGKLGKFPTFFGFLLSLLSCR